MGIENGKCTVCGGTDFTPAGTCRACNKKRNDAYRAKAAGGKVKAKTPKPAKAPARATHELVVDACFGFQAAVNGDGYLEIQQRDQSGEVTDTLTLSRPEFRQLVDKFGAWAAE
jgi:hypothetical protein